MTITHLIDVASATLLIWMFAWRIAIMILRYRFDYGLKLLREGDFNPYGPNTKASSWFYITLFVCIVWIIARLT